MRRHSSRDHYYGRIYPKAKRQRWVGRGHSTRLLLGTIIFYFINLKANNNYYLLATIKSHFILVDIEIQATQSRRRRIRHTQSYTKFGRDVCCLPFSFISKGPFRHIPKANFHIISMLIILSI